VSAVAFTPDNKQLLIATGEWNRPGRVERLDLDSWKMIQPLHHTGEVTCIAVSPDGKTIAAGGGDSAVSVWRTSKHRSAAATAEKKMPRPE
jgi:WD40 repeat protein